MLRTRSVSCDRHLALLVGCARDGDEAGLVAAIAADPDAVHGRDRRGLTVLHHAAASAAPTLLNILLAQGADPKAVDEDGNTPLHAAAEEGNREGALLLLTRGADVTAENAKWRTALDVAVAKGHSETAEVLRGHLKAAAARPLAPAIEVRASSSGTVAVTWTLPATPPLAPPTQEVEVSFRRRIGLWQAVPAVAAGLGEALVTGLQPDSVYVFRARGFSANGWGSHSRSLTARTLSMQAETWEQMMDVESLEDERGKTLRQAEAKLHVLEREVAVLRSEKELMQQRVDESNQRFQSFDSELNSLREWQAAARVRLSVVHMARSGSFSDSDSSDGESSPPSALPGDAPLTARERLAAVEARLDGALLQAQEADRKRWEAEQRIVQLMVDLERQANEVLQHRSRAVEVDAEASDLEARVAEAEARAAAAEARAAAAERAAGVLGARLEDAVSVVQAVMQSQRERLHTQ